MRQTVQGFHTPKELAEAKSGNGPLAQRTSGFRTRGADRPARNVRRWGRRRIESGRVDEPIPPHARALTLRLFVHLSPAVFLHRKAQRSNRSMGASGRDFPVDGLERALAILSQHEFCQWDTENSQAHNMRFNALEMRLDALVMREDALNMRLYAPMMRADAPAAANRTSAQSRRPIAGHGGSIPGQPTGYAETPEFPVFAPYLATGRAHTTQEDKP